ncbi:MAG: thiamine phosphate synthase [Rhodobacterales bacterium]|nr:MAG: thiamine phosphate synthase [Rhodobacterales bacterium]
MADTYPEKEQAQLYLITPAAFDLAVFPDQLQRVLDRVEVACMRLSLASADEGEIIKAADALRQICHARDIPLVIERHLMLVERLGLDGVHLPDAARSVRYARKELGKDAIIGSDCGNSSHDGLNAGEAGADYVSFGPCAAGALGDGRVAPAELFQWWSDVVEVPVVAEGGLTADLIRSLSPISDFFAIGPEIWNSPDPAAALAELAAAIE